MVMEIQSAAGQLLSIVILTSHLTKCKVETIMDTTCCALCWTPNQSLYLLPPNPLYISSHAAIKLYPR